MARKFLFALCLIGITSLARADVTVVSSVRPLQFIAAAIVGDGDRTISLIGASDSPHSFALTPQDRLAIDQADILLWVSPGFELYLADLFTALEGNKSVITVADLQASQGRNSRMAASTHTSGWILIMQWPLQAHYRQG